MDNGPAACDYEAFSLIKRLPCALAALVSATTTPSLPFSYKTCYVELRAAALLLYPLPAAEIHSLGPNPDPAAPNNSSHQPPITALARFTASVDPIVALLKEARVKCRADKLSITLNKYSNISIRIRIRFPTKQLFATWAQSIRAAAEAPGRTLLDYKVIKPIGKGASGRVYLVCDKLSSEKLALKAIDKASAFESADSYRHAIDERLAMQLAGKHPFVLELTSAFQSTKCLYLITEFCPGGDLFDYLRQRGKPLSERHACRVAAQVLSAIQHIHSLGVIYRDLKLENVLLDSNGHIRVADFGLSKIAEEGCARNKVRATTFCGTREYVSPEMLGGEGYGQSVDLWACGILFYEILCGRTPFYAATREEVYGRIQSAPLKFPRHLSADVVSLIRRLLDRNPATRLGVGPRGLDEVKNHPFFQSIDWEALHRREPHSDDLPIDPKVDIQIDDAENELKFLLDSANDGSQRKGIVTRFRSEDQSVQPIPGYSFWEQKSVHKTPIAPAISPQQQPRPPAVIIGSGELGLESDGVSSMSGLLRPLSKLPSSQRGQIGLLN